MEVSRRDFLCASAAAGGPPPLAAWQACARLVSDLRRVGNAGGGARPGGRAPAALRALRWRLARTMATLPILRDRGTHSPAWARGRPRWGRRRGTAREW